MRGWKNNSENGSRNNGEKLNKQRVNRVRFLKNPSCLLVSVAGKVADRPEGTLADTRIQTSVTTTVPPVFALAIPLLKVLAVTRRLIPG